MRPRARSARPSAGFSLAVTCGYLVAWVGLDRLAALYMIAPEASVWTPALGLSLALLLVFGLRFAPLLLLAAGLEFFTGGSTISLTTDMSLAVVDLVLLSGAAWLALGPLDLDPRLARQHDVLVVVALLGVALPLVTGLASVVVLTVGDVGMQEGLVSTFLATAAGDANGIVALTPALLVVLRPFPGVWRTLSDPPVEIDLPHGRERYETAAELVLLVLALFAAYGPTFGGPLDTVYVAWIPMLYVAVRHGVFRTSIFLLLLNAGAVGLAARRVQDNEFNLQFGLLTVTLSGLVLAAVVTERRQHADQLQHHALHDPLTGLPNRTLLRDRIRGASRRVLRRPGSAFGVLYVDLDRFKAVNDTFGHSVGDELLRAVADRLAEAVRPADTVARVGGDEFVVVVEDITDEDEARAVADRVLAHLQRSFQVADREFTVGATIGLATAEDGTTPEELLRDADTALNQAKSTRRGQVLPFAQPMRTKAVEELTLEHELRRALDTDELGIVLQPIIALPEGTVHSLEVLARWTHPRRGPISSETFIRVAEETGLVHAVARRILRLGCRVGAELSGEPDGAAPAVAVNVSAHQLERSTFADEITAALRDTGLPAGRLELEITESAWVDRAVHSARQLQELRHEGVHFVIDDFGSGYSSFAYLRRLPVSGLKLDHEFVGNLPGDRDAEVIAEAVVAMAGRLSLSVTAEGVERPEQLEYLRAIGCDRVQGRLLAAEMEATDLHAWLDQRRPSLR